MPNKLYFIAEQTVYNIIFNLNVDKGIRKRWRQRKTKWVQFLKRKKIKLRASLSDPPKNSSTTHVWRQNMNEICCLWKQSNKSYRTKWLESCGWLSPELPASVDISSGAPVVAYCYFVFSTAEPVAFRARCRRAVCFCRCRKADRAAGVCDVIRRTGFQLPASSAWSECPRWCDAGSIPDSARRAWHIHQNRLYWLVRLGKVK